MAEPQETGSESVFEALMPDADVLMSEHPQELHAQKLAEGIEEMFPGMVVLRKMGDIQAMTRSPRSPSIRWR